MFAIRKICLNCRKSPFSFSSKVIPFPYQKLFSFAHALASASRVDSRHKCQRDQAPREILRLSEMRSKFVPGSKF